MEERNVGMKWISPKQGLCRTKNLTIMLPEVQLTPTIYSTEMINLPSGPCGHLLGYTAQSRDWKKPHQF